MVLFKALSVLALAIFALVVFFLVLLGVLAVTALIISYFLEVRVFVDLNYRKSGLIKKDAFAYVMFLSRQVLKIDLLEDEDTKHNKKKNKSKKNQKNKKAKPENSKKEAEAAKGNGNSERKIEEKSEGEEKEELSRFDIIVNKIKKNPNRFLSDSLVAFRRLKPHLIQLIVSLIAAANVRVLELKLRFGLSNPADTGVVFGVLHSFKGGVLAALSYHIDQKKNKFKKLEKSLLNNINENVILYPDMNDKTIEFDLKLDVSYRLISYYYPLLRFALKKDTIIVFKDYVYPYFIRK